MESMILLRSFISKVKSMSDEIKVQKGMGVDGLNHPRLTISTRNTGMLFEMEEEKDNFENDAGIEYHKYQGKSFLGFITYIHDHFEEMEAMIKEYRGDSITLTIPLESYVDEHGWTKTNNLFIQFFETPDNPDQSHISVSISVDSSFIGKEQEADKQAFAEIARIATIHSRSYNKKDGVKAD